VPAFAAPVNSSNDPAAWSATMAAPSSVRQPRFLEQLRLDRHVDDVRDLTDPALRERYRQMLGDMVVEYLRG
jgi:hypothetical protein